MTKTKTKTSKIKQNETKRNQLNKPIALPPSISVMYLPFYLFASLHFTSFHFLSLHFISFHLGTRLPIPELIPMVAPEFKPFAANFAIVLIDISIRNECSPDNTTKALKVLMHTLYSVINSHGSNQYLSRSRFNTLENSLCHYCGYFSLKTSPLRDRYFDDDDDDDDDIDDDDDNDDDDEEEEEGLSIL